MSQQEREADAQPLARRAVEEVRRHPATYAELRLIATVDMLEAQRKELVDAATRALEQLREVNPLPTITISLVETALKNAKRGSL